MLSTLLLLSATIALSFGDSNIFTQLCACKITCNAIPSFTVNGSTLYPSDFNAISFGDFTIASGDVEGRVAVAGNFNSAGTIGVSIGQYLPTSNLSVSLIVGGNAIFNSGAVYPTNAGIVVGGTFTGSSSLQMQVYQGCGTSTGCFATSFTSVKNYFNSISTGLNGVSSNVVITGTQELMINCSTTDSVYYINIDGGAFSQINNYITNNCASTSVFVFNIAGTSDVYFNGHAFPTNVAVYNVIEASNVYVNTSINGDLLCPSSTYTQTGGTAFGQIVAGTFAAVVEIDLPGSYGGASSGSVSTASTASASTSSSNTGSDSPATGSAVCTGVITYSASSATSTAAATSTASASTASAAGTSTASTASTASAVGTSTSTVITGLYHSSASTIAAAFGLVALTAVLAL